MFDASASIVWSISGCTRKLPLAKPSVSIARKDPGEKNAVSPPARTARLPSLSGGLNKPGMTRIRSSGGIEIATSWLARRAKTRRALFGAAHSGRRARGGG
jgi:hypothetical protein